MRANLLRGLMLSEVLLGAGLGYWLANAQHWPQWTAIVLAIALPFAIMVLVNIASALISRESKEPMGMWLRSVLGEAYASIVIFIFRQPWTTGQPTLLAATGGTPKVPVVLVHGYLCNHRIWDDVATTLRAQGHDVFAVNLEPTFGSIDDYAPIVEAAAQALLTHTGQAKVALVGHSKGGLAIRAWMRAYGTDRVARVLTLGTPHAGTALAKLAIGHNAKQMRWQSQWLAALASSETDTTRQLVRIALTPQDNIVCPQRHQVLPGVVPTVFDGIGHLQMCLHQPVIEWVRAELVREEST